MVETNESVINAFFEKLKEIEISNGLDIATGKGEFIAFAHDIFGKIEMFTGIDTHPRILEMAQKAFPDYTFKQMNAYQIDYPDSNFDFVSISNSLHHLKDPIKALYEMTRVLKPGGYLVIREMLADDCQSEAQKSHVLIHHFSAEIDEMMGRYHKTTFTGEEVEDFEAKLQLSSSKSINYDYPMSAEAIKKNSERYALIVDAILKPISETDNFDEYKQKGEAIKEHILKHGFAPARAHLFVGIK